ncbi:MAG: CaiB/BaiF CoA transferase family protein [Hyphomicrobiaceae bacterium]
MSSMPLNGLKVLEFSHAVMGPTAGLILAELGADVIKVEPAPGGDPTRRLGGFAAGFFPAFNRSKRSIAIDLKRPEGQALLHRLVKDTDILLENYAPGTMDRLGCGYDVLSDINPRLIYLALKGYLSGPYDKRPALDEVVQFQSGLAYMTGQPGRPSRAGASVIDILGAAFGIIAAQAALHERTNTGKGQRLSSALFESAVFLMITHMAGFAATGQAQPPMPARKSAWSIYEVFNTADDGSLFIGVTSDQQWQRFAEEFALADLASDPRLETNQMRIDAREWLLPRLHEALKRYELSELMARCERANVSWAPVGRPEDLFADAHLAATNGLLDVVVKGSSGAGQTFGLPAMPFEFHDGADRPGLRGQPPELGADTAEVLRAAGVPDDELRSLAAAKVIVQA